MTAPGVVRVPPSAGGQGIRDAIAEAGDGAYVRLERGTYDLTEPLIVDTDDVTLVGAGAGPGGTRLRLADCASSSVLTSHEDPTAAATDRLRHCYRDFRIDGNESGVTTAGHAVHGVWSRSTFRNVHVVDSYADSFRFESPSDAVSYELTLQNCVAVGGHGTGFRYGAGVGDALVQNCVAGELGGLGFELAGWPLRLVGAHAYDCLVGAKTNYARMVQFVACDFETNDREGVVVDGKTPGLVVLALSTVRGNSRAEAGRYSNVRLTDSSRNVIAGTVIRGAETPGDTPTANHGVTETGTANRTLVLGNVIGGHVGDDVDLVGPDSSRAHNLVG